MRTLSSLFWFLCPSVAWADLPAGEPIPGAILVDVTPDGFDAIEEMLPDLVPASIAIPEVHEWDEDCFGVFGWDVACYGYQLDVTNGWVDVSIDALDIRPATDWLVLDGTGTVMVNNYWDPIYVYAWAEGGLFDWFTIDLDMTCTAYVDPVTVDITSGIYLDVVTDPTTQQRVLDANVPTPLWGWDMTGDKIHLDCGTVTDIINAVNEVMALFNFNLYDLVVPPAEALINGFIADMAPQIEAILEQTFNVANVHEDVPVMDDVVLTIDLAPDDVVIVPSGLRLSMEGSFDADPHPCVEVYGIDESLETPSDPPDVGSAPAGLPWTHHVGVAADDDFLNQALFSTWRAGLLCQTLVDDGTLPLPLDTSLLGLVAPGVFDELFPEPAPLVITTRPAEPPIAYAGGNHDIGIEVKNLGLDWYGELDGRMSRVIGLGLEADAGMDLSFDAGTGELGIEVALTGDDVSATVGYNELAPDGNATIEGAFQGVFDGVLGPLLGGLTGDLTFPLPAFEGIGLTGIAVEPTGSAFDRFGVYGTAGSVTYTGAGCDGSGSGCDTSGCSGGCSSGRATYQGMLLVLPLLVAWRRRRV